MSKKNGAKPDHTAAIQQLLGIMHEHDLDALKVDIGSASYELVRREPQALPATPALPVAGEMAAPPPPASAAAAPPAGSGRAKKVTAPLIGVFYRSPAPGADPFVNIGDRVEVGQTLCILEAMKLMNEIASDYAGVVTRVIPESGELVTISQELFWIEP